jgi:hypothetical protein
MSTAPLDPRRIIEALERHRVDYVVIGGFAAFLHRTGIMTVDVDITPRRERSNLGRLAAALAELGARLAPPESEPIAIALDEHTFDWGTTWTFVTEAGELDVSFLPDGTQGYADLIRDAQRVTLRGGLEVPVASLADVVRSKEAAGRPKDRAALPVLRLALEEQARERSKENGEGDPR